MLGRAKSPDGSEWVYEIKLDGCRALGIKSDRGVTPVSRCDNSFKRQYPLIVEALGVFHLEGKLVGVAIGTPAAVSEPLNAAFLIASKDLVAGLAGDAKLPAKFRHRLAGWPASH